MNDQELAPIDSGPHGALHLREDEFGSSQTRRTEGSRQLGVGGILLMVVAAAAPLGFVAATIPVIMAVSQSVATPQYFIIAMVILLLFAVGFTAMSPHVRNAGAFYSYVQAGLGRVTGLGAATLAIGSYGLLLLAVNAYFGVTMNNLVVRYSAVELPWWLYSLAALGVVAFLAYRDIEVSSRVLGFLLAAETLVVVVLDVGIVISGGEAGLTAQPFSPTELGIGAPALGLMFAFFGFIGFEATAVFRNEAKSPDRTIPRATFVAIIGIGIFYALSSWAVIVGSGVDNAVGDASTSPSTLVIDLAATYVSPVVADVMQVLLVTSVFACVLSFHNVITRYEGALAQKGVLPRWLGQINLRHNAPSRASLVLSAVTLVVTLLLIVAGPDPIALYTWLSGAATLGIVALMALTSTAVIVYFRRSRTDSRPWQTVIAPTGALIGLLIILALVVSNFTLLTGDSVSAGVLGTLIVVTFGVGIVTALIIKVRRPNTFAALGDDSSTAETETTLPLSALSAKD